jgi:hypothetical protein
MAWFKKLSNDVNKAVSGITAPFELGDLDSLVEILTCKYDRMIANATFPGIPTQEICVAAEVEWTGLLNKEYNSESQKICGRTERNDDDNIAVRRRILNRQFHARSGKLYGRFGNVINNAVALAEASLRSAAESVRETQNSVSRLGAVKPEVIINEFAALKKSITDQVANNYPGGEEALDRFDDSLPGGVLSLADLRIHIEQCQIFALDANHKNIVNHTNSLKKAIHDEAVEEITAAINKIRGDLQVDLPFLDEAARAALVAEANAELDSFVEFINAKK